MSIPAEHESRAPFPEIFAGRHPGDLCLHHLIEARAEQHPDAIAIVRGDETITYGADAIGVVRGEGTITYGELDRRASRLALYLASLGVEPEVTVGIYAPRSPEAIVAMLAVSKAGGAFLPLDPSYPEERLRFMIEDASARVVLARGELPAGLRAAAPCVISLNAPAAETTPVIDPSLPDPALGLGGRQTAYVMYTSGSTGRPKGVAVAQRSLVHYLRNAVAQYGIDSGDRVLQFSSLSFDASLEEIGIALAAGARLVLRDDAMLGSVSRFLSQCRAWGVTAIGIPTAFWHELVLGIAAQDLPWPPSIRLVIIGSERALPERLRTWRQRVDRRVRLMNTYGPTEATIVATMCNLADLRDEEVGAGELPIGRPLPDVQALLFDDQLREVAAGEVGEVYLGGEGLARGYHGRPDLTAEKLLPHPNGEGERLYATGDLARLRPDGSLEFAGRKDRQVKLRGFRIELLEIERVLARHPEVLNAAVTVHGAPQALIAYVATRVATRTTADELRAWVRQCLPEFMVPSRFVLLDRLPQGPNGKVDLSALPAPEEAREGAAPRNATEARILEIWKEVLGVRQAGIHDDFLESGGDSLSALQLAGRLQEISGVEVSLEIVLSHGSIARLAEALLGDARGIAPQPPPIVPQPRTGPLPVSFQQQSIWIMSQMAGSTVPYNNQVTIRLEGALNVPALTRAFSEIVARHEVFRTSVADTDQGIVQTVHEPQPAAAPVVDLSGLPAELRGAEAERWVHAECARPFDLGRFPLVRWTLLRLASEEHLLIQVEQHFGHDGWSLARLLHEISALYPAFAEGRPSPLPPLPIQFADYAVWQRQWMRGEVLETFLDHWRRRLAGCPPVLELPTDRPRPKNQSFRGRTRVQTLSPGLSRSLREASRREGTTLFVTLLAAFKALICRYTGCEDVVLGTAVANRARPETRNLIGMMANAVIVRSDLSGRPSFRALSRRVRERAFEAYAFQELPFELLVEDYHHCRDNSRNPMFQAMFSFHDAPVPDLRLPGLTGELEYRYNGSAKFDLDITVIPAPADGDDDDETLIEWEYSTDLFDAATIERMVRHYDTLLEGALADPGRRLPDLPLLTAEESAQALAGWQDLRGPGRQVPDLSERFSAQVLRAPDAVAVIDGGRSVSYREAAGRSRALAANLSAWGIGRGAVVALLARRGADFLAAVLALSDLGAAWLPLDPSHPVQRLAGILRQSRVREVLAEDALADWIEEALGREQPAVLRLGALLDGPGREIRPTAEGEDLAYVIYTSGSTGEPKGAMVTRQGMLNHLAGKVEHLGLTASDVVAQTASQAFDISVWQFLAPLATGGTVAVLDDATVRDPQALLAAVEREKVTVLETVPSMLRFLLDELDESDAPRPSFAALRWLLVTAEALPADLCRRWLEHYPHVPLLNAYGPTECSDDVTHHVISEAAGDRLRVPIGRPLPDVRVHVLDRDGNLVPAGVSGELCVGGIAVGRGYLHHPGKTAESFVPDPFSDRPGGRLYRTGDLARRLPDGTIEYLGRFDHQVKLRGYRIELEEIEAALNAHPRVRDAVVALRKDPGFDECLAAYLVSDPGAALSIADLRSHLWNRLPESMIPQYFVTLPELPLNANGKVDRAKLPPPPRVAVVAEAVPMSRTEEIIAGIWRQVLGLERVVAHSNFWELGGYSIQATRVLTRLRRALDVDLRLPDFFAAPTVERLAQTVDSALPRS